MSQEGSQAASGHRDEVDGMWGKWGLLLYTDSFGNVKIFREMPRYAGKCQCSGDVNGRGVGTR